MKILLKSVEIVDASNTLAERVNILIEDGIITQISSNLPASDEVIEGKNLKVSAGWIDMNAFLGEPGFEHKETIETGTLAAAKGGFTEVVCMPNSLPVIQDKNTVLFYTSRNKESLITLLPLGAVTLNTQGSDLTDMLDMHKAGAVGFGDGFKSLNNSDIILKTLQYLSKIGAVLINRPNECSISNSGVANEGVNSTMLGLKGIPAIAEEIAITRDLKLLEYTGGRIHFSNISTAEGVKLIREAKKKGLNVTCDIAAHQIAFNDIILKDFDTNFKVNPPFRTTSDIEELWKGLKDGTIDVITSAHNPQDEESKKLEFDLAEFGIIGLETAFSVINTLNKNLTISEIVEKFAVRPREILGLPLPQIEVGQIANLTVFDSEMEWDYKENDILSKSKNSPFINYKFKGKPLAVFNNRKNLIDPVFIKQAH